MEDIRTRIVIPDYQTELELSGEEPIALTFSIAEVRDITARVGNYSKSLELPGNDNNNRLFGHIFDINTFDWTFDVNTKTKAYIYSDSNLIFDGHIKLVNIKREYTTINEELKITYVVSFTDSTSSFIEKIKAKTLEDLDLSQYNHRLTLDTILSAQTNDYRNGYTYPLLKKNGTDNNWVPEDFQPAFYVKTILDKIFIDAGYGYTSNFLNSDLFKKLIILENKNLANNPFELNQYIAKVNDTDTITLTNFESVKPYYFGGDDAVFQIKNKDFNKFNGRDFAKQVTFTNKTYDQSNLFDTTGSYITGDGAENEISFNHTLQLNFNNTFPYLAYIRHGENEGYRFIYTAYLVEEQDISYTYAAYDYVNLDSTITSDKLIVSKDVKVMTDVLDGTQFPSGQLITKEIEVTSTFSNVNLKYGKKYKIYVNFQFENTNFAMYVPAYSSTNIVDMDVKLVGVRTLEKIRTTAYKENTLLYMDDFVPQKMKQSDFLVSLVKMFNLYIDKDKTRDNNFIIEPRSDYYGSYEIHNWSDKIDNKYSELSLLSDLQNKQIKFRANNLTTNFGKTHFDQTNEEWGEKVIVFENEYLIDENEIRHNFTVPSTVYVQPNVPIYIPNISTSESTNSTYIMYATPASAVNYTIVISGATAQTQLNTYMQALHTDDVDDPGLTLCYNWPTTDNIVYEYRSLNSLYNKYWFSYIEQIANGKLLTCYANLNGNDIHRVNFNDRIWIESLQSYFVLNSIIDYSPNTNSLTKVELIQINEGFDWIEQPREYYLTGSTQMIKTQYENLRESKSTVIGKEQIVYGRRNFNTAQNTLLAGNDNLIQVPNNTVVVGDTNSFIRSSSISTNDFGTRPETEQEQPALVVGTRNQINNTNTALVIGNDNVINEDQDILAKIGNAVITSGGIYFEFNMVDGGLDTVYNPMRRFPENLIDGGEDCIKGTRGISLIDKIDGSQDAVLGSGRIS